MTKEKNNDKPDAISREIDVFGNVEPIRSLSWKNPYGRMMLHGKIETRTWHTKYRGLVLICVSRQIYSDGVVKEISGLEQMFRIPILYTPGSHLNQYAVDLGFAIAVGRLVDCRRMKPEDEDATFVKYNPALWCHIYEKVTPITPIPWKGSQGWGKVPEEIQNILFSGTDLIHRL